MSFPLNKFYSQSRNCPCMTHNGGGMASKGLRANHLQSTPKVEAGYKPSHTIETLIGYDRVLCRRAFIYLSIL